MKEIKKQAMGLEPIVRIGKSGLTEGMVKEIKRHLMQKSLIKVKFISSVCGELKKKEFAKKLADATDSKLIHSVGFVAVLHRK